MSKRLYEIARDLGVTSTELSQRIVELGLDVDVKSHLTELSEEQIGDVTRSFTAKTPPRDTVKKVVNDGVIRRRVRRKVAGGEAEVVADAAAVEPAAVHEPAPAAAAPAPEPTPEPVRKRMATLVTRSAEELAPKPEPVPVVEVVEAPAVDTAEDAPAEDAPRRSRFATVHTREVEAITQPEQPVDESVDTGASAAPRSRFATVVTGPQPSVGAGGRPTLREFAASQAPAADAARGGARVVGTMNPELLNVRLEADRKDFNPRRPAGDGPVADKKGKKSKGKRVVQSGDLYDKFSGRGGRGGRQKAKGPAQQTQITQAAEHKRVVKMEDTILVGDLAHQMGVKGGEIAMKLMFDLGIKGANINTAIDFDTAMLVAEMYSFRIEQVGFDITKYLPQLVLDETAKRTRPPVVTVMGHVDHGKTSLLDAIRSESVAVGEAGGITQHIGAYTVKLETGDITFLDTPGHEAFTALRARGAVATDITVLVVAADDGVMPQTVEAINHSKDAGVPIIVAVNKCDKENANPDRVKQALSQYDLIPEAWGGTTLFTEVSALTKHGIDTLLDAIHLQSELLELRAHFERPAEGLVIESKLDVGRGPVATVLVQEGTLKAGDTVVVGEHYGRIRTMTNERNDTVVGATPAMPVEITGLSGVPVSGEKFYVVDAEKNAKEIASHVAAQVRQAEMAQRVGPSGDLFGTSDLKQLKIIVKADVQGSVEAVVGSLTKLSTEAVEVRVIHSGVGAITESDINLAASSEEGVRVVVIGFNTKPDNRASNLADQLNVSVLTEAIIYDIVDKITGLMTGMLEPIYVEVPLGKAEVRATFNVPRFGQIAGCMVSDGKIVRNEKCRVLRNGNVVADGTINSLRRFEENVPEVKNGFECGLSVSGFDGVEIGDIVECFTLKEERATL